MFGTNRICTAPQARHLSVRVVIVFLCDITKEEPLLELFVVQHFCRWELVKLANHGDEAVALATSSCSKMLPPALATICK
jgi:hypothetical protein